MVEIAHFPKISMIRLFKLIVHSIFLVIALMFVSLFSADIVGWAIGRPIEASKGLVLFAVAIWLLFALQSKKYRKEN